MLFEYLGVGALAALVLSFLWWLNRAAERRKLAQTSPAENDEEVRVRPGYTLRVSPQAVRLINLPSPLLVWFSLFPAGLGVLGLAAPITLQAFAWGTKNTRLQAFSEQVLGEGLHLGGCLFLMVSGGILFAASRRRIELVLESQGPIRYRRERFLREVEEWEIEPSSFVELVVTPRGRGIVSLIGGEASAPRYVFDCTVRTNLEADMELVNAGLLRLAAAA